MKHCLKVARRHPTEARELNRLLWLNLAVILALLFLLVLFKAA